MQTQQNTEHALTEFDLHVYADFEASVARDVISPTIREQIEQLRVARIRSAGGHADISTNAIFNSRRRLVAAGKLVHCRGFARGVTTRAAYQAVRAVYGHAEAPRATKTALKVDGLPLWRIVAGDEMQLVQAVSAEDALAKVSGGK